jgi:hypothetical protein
MSTLTPEERLVNDAQLLTPIRQRCQWFSERVGDGKAGKLTNSSTYDEQLFCCGFEIPSKRSFTQQTR